MDSTDRRKILVWDLPTRLFHWSLVLLVGLNLFVIGPRGGLSTVIHFVLGYVIAGLLLFRFFWGFIGSPRSRFRDFVRPWPKLRAYLARLLRFDPPHSIGHNPVGGWMILGLLGLLLLMVVTGLFGANRRAAGPFAPLLGAGSAGLMGELHSLLSSVLIAFIIVHVTGVLAEWMLTGENLIRSMITGRKRLAEAEAAAEPPVAPVWRAAILAILALALVIWLVWVTDYGLNRATIGSNGSQAPGTGTAAPL
jgi:cytochrome b